MGNYAVRKDVLVGWQINVAQMMFRGMTDEEICVEQFHIDKEDKKKMKYGREKLRKLRKNEKFQEFYKSMITEWTVKYIGPALTKLASQINNKNDWLANKACNDILNQSKHFTGADDNTVTIKIDSGIELGTPDGE